MKKEKVYVDIVNNKTAGDQKRIFSVLNKVIVKDLSYMVGASGKAVTKDMFQILSEDGHILFELFTIRRTNIPFRTNYKIYERNSKYLGVHNNCEIEGNDGEIYYCSRINIERFTN
jgi:hypothetical protein